VHGVEGSNVLVSVGLRALIERYPKGLRALLIA
jgi:hypothetical protein